MSWFPKALIIGDSLSLIKPSILTSQLLHTCCDEVLRGDLVNLVGSTEVQRGLRRTHRAHHPACTAEGIGEGGRILQVALHQLNVWLLLEKLLGK